MINFPKMHIATSVVNRILNASQEIERSTPRVPVPSFSPAPVVPDPSAEGEAIDEALQQPTATMPPLEDDPASDTANALEPILHGGTSLDGLVDTISGM